MNKILKKQGISKPMGIALFTIAMLIMAVIILFYRNPLADQGQEWMKKIIACIGIAVMIVVFICFYDKITVAIGVLR